MLILKKNLFSNHSGPLNVIGNSERILTQKNKELINSAETIRFNRIDIVNEESQGSRWDFLATSELKTFEKYNKEFPKFHSLIFTPHLKNHFDSLSNIEFSCNLYFIPQKITEELFTEINNFNPSTGTHILFYLHKINFKNLNIFGFDWKEHPTIYDPLRKKDPHNYNKEKELILRIAEKNKWNIY